MSEERGSSMIEVIGVISVIAILGIGVWTLLNSAYARFRLSQGVIQLQTLEKGITRFYAAAGNYDGLANTNAVKELIENNIPPKGMATAEKTLVHAFGGDVEIKNVAYTNVEEFGSLSDSFTITFKSLKVRECMEMASMSWTEGDTVNLVSITVGSNKFVWPSFSAVSDDEEEDEEENGEEGGVNVSVGRHNTLPVSLIDAKNSCSNETTDVIWEFR